jgi:pimeloyl-ACP methyl ester carboxylesterase
VVIRLAARQDRAMDAATQVIALTDGRQLAFAEFGDPRGAPLFYFHGWPSSRLEGGLIDEPARQAGIRIIAADRPGFGRSTHRKRRTILDWPDDVAALADALGIDRFAVLGHSGGAPFALACALRLEVRLAGVGIVSGLAPPEAYVEQPRPWRSRWLRRLGRWAPATLGPLVRLSIRQLDRDPERYFKDLGADMATVDQVRLADPAHRDWLMRSGREAVSRGVAGAVLENTLVNRGWGFDLRSIRRDVYVWHGDLDVIVPVAVAHRVAELLPISRATFYPDDGHVSLLPAHAEEILRTLCPGAAALG